MDEQVAELKRNPEESTWFWKNGKLRLTHIIAGVIGLALVISGMATVSVLAEYSPLETDLTNIIALLNLDLILALLLGAVLARRIVLSWISRKYGSAGSRLHTRIVVSFGMVAIVPAILVTVFSGLFLNFAIETWFSERVRTAVNASSEVARSYLQEHQLGIRGAALAMANDLNRAAPALRQNPKILTQIVRSQSYVRNLSEAVVVNSSGQTIARSELSFSLGFNFSSDALLKRVLNGRPGEVFIINSSGGDRVRAAIKLEAFVDAYLLVGRIVAPQILEHVSQTEGAAAQYAQLEKSRSNLQIKFLFVFVLVAVLLLLVAIWIGWSIASQLSTPIGELIDAADKVRKGDLTVRVQTSASSERDEIGVLSRSFNRMTEQLDSQQEGLMEANRQLDERRRFTETVLTGVSAGVIGLDRDSRINLPNRSASDLLATKLSNHLDEDLSVVVPEMKHLLSVVTGKSDKSVQGEIRIHREGRQRTLMVSMVAEKIADEIIGYVVTFDDVTELFSAQRKAAWADVARRIAHEIKNPLTPIQLSAERLRRKYQDEIASDRKTFMICTETIIRQVEDIGRMVDEFSAFARMPQPELKRIDLVDLCQQSLFLEKNRFPEIKYESEKLDDAVMHRCDRLQVGRALTNVLKNAAESIDAKEKEAAVAIPSGEIILKLELGEDVVSIDIYDNGKGFPEDLIDRITEPYVTTRNKGSGLGLAIAAKIMEDHGGELKLNNNQEKGGGAVVSLLFRRRRGEDTVPDASQQTKHDKIKAETSS